MNQKERDNRTIIWCMDIETASKYVAKTREMGIKVSCYAENNIFHMNSNFTKQEYNKLFS